MSQQGKGRLAVSKNLLGVSSVFLTNFFIYNLGQSFLCTYQCKAGGGGGRAWGGDLIVSVVPGVGHLTDLVLPGEGIFESFFTRRGDI